MPAGILSVFLFCLLTFSSDCYISSYPRGGKRALPEPEPPARECTRCGSQNRNTCFGPSLCCPENGPCIRGLKIQPMCQREKAFPFPCQEPGRPCGGECRDVGFCCRNGICICDPNCPQKVWIEKIDVY